MNINWFAVTIICIWLFACLACRWTKNCEPMGCAFFATLVMGFGYFIISLE